MAYDPETVDLDTWADDGGIVPTETDETQE